MRDVRALRVCVSRFPPAIGTGFYGCMLSEVTVNANGMFQKEGQTFHDTEYPLVFQT